MYWMAGSPRSMRSRLTMTKTCSGMGRLSTMLSETSIGATPSAERAESMAARKSVLLGAIFEDGLFGGRMPAAPAGAIDHPDANTAPHTVKAPHINLTARPPPRHFISVPPEVRSFKGE